MTDASDIIAELRHKRAEGEYERIPGYEAVGGGPVPGTGPIEGVRVWQGRVYAARSGCIWMATEEGWTLADGEALPPGFPPRKERPDDAAPTKLAMRPMRL